jgi:hypothetical protein
MAIGLRLRRYGAVHLQVAAAAAASTLAFGTPAAAFDVKKSVSGQDLHWTDSAITYHLDSSVADAADGAAGGITAAASVWSGVQGAPALTVVQGGGGAAPGYDGLNTVFYAHRGSALTGGALAVTVLTYDENGHVLDADIVIYGRYPFAILPASATAPTGAQPVSNEGALLAQSSAPFDLQHVLGHELGHSLGLADETASSSSLMFLYSAPGAASPRAPSSDDTSGIASLYDTGSPTGGAGCGAAVSPRTPTNAASRGALAISLGLIAWALARRRRGPVAKALAWGVLAMTTVALAPDEHAARTAERTTAHASAHARVSRVESSVDVDGLFQTRATLGTIACRTAQCPPASSVVVYGGTVGALHQEIGGVTVPREGDEVEIAFDAETLEARIAGR